MAASPNSKPSNAGASVSISQKKASKSWKPVLVSKLELPGDKINKGRVFLFSADDFLDFIWIIKNSAMSKISVIRKFQNHIPMVIIN